MSHAASATTADIVIIGGGIVGLTLAIELAERGAGRISLLEQAHCGAGATLRATGGFRLQFGTAINIQLSLLARPHWRRFDERFGSRIAFTERGYLLLAATAAQHATQARQVALQQSLGVPSRLVEPAALSQLTPGLVTDDLVGGSFCPWDASLELAPMLAALVDAARRLGVAIDEGEAVTGLRTSGQRIIAVATSRRTLAAPIVVNAAGTGAAAIGAMVGLNLPVRGERRQAAATLPAPGLDPAAPMTIDLGTGCYARPALNGGAIIGGGDLPVPAELADDAVDPAWLERTRRLVGQRQPALAGIALQRAWAGQRPMTPDEHPILGPTPIDGLLCAVGLGGHGVMHAPAVAQLLSELIVDGAASSLDIEPLALARFASGRLLTEAKLF